MDGAEFWIRSRQIRRTTDRANVDLRPRNPKNKVTCHSIRMREMAGLEAHRNVGLRR